MASFAAHNIMRAIQEQQAQRGQNYGAFRVPRGGLTPLPRGEHFTYPGLDSIPRGEHFTPTQPPDREQDFRGRGISYGPDVRPPAFPNLPYGPDVRPLPLSPNNGPIPYGPDVVPPVPHLPYGPDVIPPNPSGMGVSTPGLAPIPHYGPRPGGGMSTGPLPLSPNNGPAPLQQQKPPKYF